MNAATTLTSNLTQQMGQYWDRRMVTRLMAETQFYDLGDMRPLPAGYGKTININRYNNLSAITTPLTEGTVPTAQTLAGTLVSTTVAQYGGYISLSDLIVVEAISDVVANAVDVLAYQARLSVDTIIRNVLNTGLTLQIANGKAGVNNLTATDVFNTTELRKVIVNLRRANVRPMEGNDFVAVIHPQAIYDLQGDTAIGAWAATNQYQNAVKIFNGEVGKLYGVRFMESTNAYTFVNTNTPTANVYYTYVLGKEAFAVVDLAKQNLKTYVKPAGTAGGADPLEQINTVGWKTTFGTVVLDAVRGIIDAAGSYQ